MRIFNVYFQIGLFLVSSVSFSPLFGKTFKINPDIEKEFHVLPDTTCGSTDTIFQLTFPTCSGDSDATARIEIEGATLPLLITWDNQSTGRTGTNLSVGKHYVTILDLDGCTFIDSVIIEDKPPLAYTIQAVDALCIGVSNGSITISDTSNLSYSWNTGDSTANLANLNTGVYQVTITDTLGCIVIENVVVNTTTQASLEVESSDATCLGINNGSAIANDTLNLTDYSYLWSNGDTTNQIMGVRTGPYFVLATSPEGCLAADSINIGVERVLPFELSITNPTCNGVNDGAIIINDTLDVTGYVFGWSTGDTTQMISGLAAGNYSVAFADTLGCIAAGATTLVNNTQLNFTTTVVNATCDIAPNGSITVNDTSDVTGLSFNWNTGDTTRSISGLLPGRYHLTVTDSNGCFVIDSADVGITPTLTLISSIQNATCNGVADGSISINEGTTDLIFNWSTGDTSQTISGLAGGTYNVVVTDEFGCTATDTFTVALTSSISVEFANTNQTCNGLADGSISLNFPNGTEGLTFSWNTGDSTQTISGLIAGDYSVTVIDSLGCIGEGNTTLQVDRSVALVGSKTDISCSNQNNGSITINEGNNDPINYLWSTGDSTQTITNLAEGTYTVTVSDTLGCIATDSFQISTLNSLELTLSSSNVSCSGLLDGSVTINGGEDISGLSINWNTGDDTQILNNIGIGIYTVTATDTMGCMAIDSIRVMADSSLLIGLTGNNINCVGIDDGRINASVVGRSSNEGLSFAWSTGDTVAIIDNLPPGDYEVTVTDTSGCFGVGGVNLNESDTLKLEFVISPVACMDTLGSGTILATVMGGASPYTYNWSTGDSTLSIEQLLAGTYSLTITDSLGCTLIDSATLVAPPDLIVNASLISNATCVGTSDGSATVIATGGTSPYQIRWNNGIITPTIENLDPGIYTVEVSDEAGCMITDSVIIGQNTLITVNAAEITSATDANTADGVANVTASGGLEPYTFNWDNGAIGATVNNLSSGNHQVIATDSNGCTGTGNVDIRFFELQVNIIEVSSLNCYGNRNGRATASPVNGTLPYQYVWSTGDTTSVVTSLPGGTHTVTVTDVDGLRGRATVIIAEPEAVNFNLEIIPPGCPTSSNGTIRINATGFTGNALYDFGVGITTNPFILGVSAGQKNYSIFYGINCRVDTSFFIEALSPNPPIPSFSYQGFGQTISFIDSTTNAPSEYLWKFGDSTTSTQINPIHEYADTGDYEVCLIVSNSCATDSLCQIISVDPIPVPGVELIFGRDTSSLSGQLVSIPVIVGAFDSIAGFSGTFELTNPMIGAIQGVRDLNLPNLMLSDITFQQNLISVDWEVQDTSLLVSLDSGTQIFVIDLLLTGASNECTQIVATNNEANLQFTKNFMGDLVSAPFTINSAEICIANTVSIIGNIRQVENTGIGGVTVTTNRADTSITNGAGNYTLQGLPGGSTFTIEASKTDDLLLGISTLDIVQILRHILRQQPLDSPYRIIAADVDNSGTITSLDLLQLQRLILQHIDAFPNNRPWHFIPEDYDFISQFNPLLEDYPESVVIDKLETDTGSIDFIAIKTGDVISQLNRSNARFLQKSMGLQIEEQEFKAGEIVKIPFNLGTNSEALGFQMELDFDYKKLAFNGHSKDNYLKITENNFGKNDIEYGHLKMLWVNQNKLPIRQMANGVFQLEFIALTNGHLSNSLQILNGQFPAQLYTEQVEKIGLQNIHLEVLNAKIELEETIIPTNNPTFLRIAENNIAGGCSDGLDNDNDGLVDCADADCFCECNMVDFSNLILNPSAESSLSSEGWQLVQGTWTTRGANPPPQDGGAYFYALNSAIGQLSQVIDLSGDADAINQGMVSYAFSAYVRSFDQDPSDEAQVLVEYRNANDSTLTAYDSGLITSVGDWQLLTDTIIPPMGTVTAIINLIARRNNGSNNDAYFDNLSLTRILDDTCVDPCEGVDLVSIATSAIPNGEGGAISTNLIGGTGPASFLWNNGATNNEITGLAPGVYSVEASDSIGCTVMDSIEVTIDSSFFVSFIITDNTCAGDSSGQIIVEITGGTAPYTLTWTDSSLIGDTLQNLSSGTYTLTAIDSTGESQIATAQIVSGSTLSLNATDSKVVNESCPNVGDGQLSLVAEGGIAPYSYILNGDTTNNGVYLGLNAGSYSVDIMDSASCGTTETIDILNTFNGTRSAAFTNQIVDSTISLSPAIIDSTASYNWTFGDGNTSTEINPVYAYSTPGAYQICLTINNPCGAEMTCQTISVGISGPVTFIINDINGIANDTVLVPVTVKNFIDIVSYQKTLQIQDTAIARFVGIADLNLAFLSLDNFFQVDNRTITTAWFDQTGLGQTLPDNTVLYNLMVMINSQVDTCIGIGIVNAPVPGQVAAIMINEVAVVPYETINGEVCTNESANITGTILRETGSAVPGVQINVSNFEKTPTTDIDGNYLIEKVSLGNDYEITPALNTPLLESVSTFDIVLINRHILGTRIFDSPYKYVAADINLSGTITVFDLVLIQRAILGLSSEFPGNTAWRFIPKSYQFSDLNNPLNETFPESINVPSLSGNLDGQDFVAVKIADVSYNIAAVETGIGPRSSQHLTLNIDNHAFKAGETIDLTMSTTDLAKLSGFQLEFNFDKNNLALLHATPVDIPQFNENNIGFKYLNQGKIQMSWVAPELEIEQHSTSLFRLTFKAKNGGMLKNNLQIGHKYLASEAYSKDLGIGDIYLNFVEVDKVAHTALTLYPNPTKGQIDLTFANPNHEKVQLLLYNFTGQLVKEWNYLEGESAQININNYTNGTYLLMLKKVNNVEVKRVVLSK